MIHIPEDLSAGKNRLITKIKRRYLDVHSVPVVKCTGCDAFIVPGRIILNRQNCRLHFSPYTAAVAFAYMISQ
jgi:hypothetical protein